MDAIRKIIEINKQHVTFYVPLRMREFLLKKLKKMATPDQIIEMDWWQQINHVHKSVASHEPKTQIELIPTNIYGQIEVTFLPSQHWSVRNLLDWNHQLWGGFGFKFTPFDTSHPNRVVYFAGDTGYNNYLFTEIKQRFSEPNGGIDTAFIPIGAYGPRWFSASQHADPMEAVQIALDVGARHSCGMHFGTFVVSTEPVLEPVEKLHQALQLMQKDFKQFHNQEDGDSFFVTVAHGETYYCKHVQIDQNVDVRKGESKDQNTAVILQMESEK
jgi:L-ascorbate metabolism protein UlaG (beta-lactamase superfamily)